PPQPAPAAPPVSPPLRACASSPSIEVTGPTRVHSCSALRCAAHLLWPLLTSGRPFPRLATPVALSGSTARSPRVLRTHLHAYACRIYAAAFRASTGL